MIFFSVILFSNKKEHFCSLSAKIEKKNTHGFNC